MASSRRLALAKDIIVVVFTTGEVGGRVKRDITE